MPLRFGRGAYSFRPGELLSDYLVNLDIREQGVDEPERFEINHHGYRFLKSACYQKSEGFGCISCHMPTRRTKDVVHVTMTDHWIARDPFDLEAIVKPVQPEIRAISSVEVLAFGEPPVGLDKQTYRSLGAMRAGRSVSEASAGLIKVIRQKDYDDYTPYLDLARAQLQQGDFSSAEAAARGLVRAEPDLYVAHTLLGIAQMSKGKYQQAKLSFRKSLAIQPDPETHFNLASVYFQTEQFTLSEMELDKAIQLRPYMARAYKMKGQIHLARNNIKQAQIALETALQLDPGDSASYQLMVTLLNELGQTSEAKRFAELGLRASRRPAS